MQNYPVLVAQITSHRHWLFVLPLLCGLVSCTTKRVIYTAGCEGKTLALQLVAENTFETITYSHELIYNGTLVDVITNENLSFSLPYSPAVYGQASWHLIDTIRQTYQPVGFSGPLTKIPVMVYVDTTVLTPDGFNAVYHCLKQHHQAMQAAMEKVSEFQPYQFGGIVYGSRETFVQRYEKNKNDYFTVYPDGRTIHTRVEPMMSTTSSGGVSNVLMPGTQLMVDTTQLPMKALNTYHNTRTGHPLSTDFRCRVDTVFHSR